MKKSTLVTLGSTAVIVPLFLLAVSINENKAEQQKINEVPKIKRMESVSAKWAEHYPRQYDSYLQTKKSDKIVDMLDKLPGLVVMWAGYGFSKDYNAPRGHSYILEDNINTLRTGAPTDGKTGPMPTACWTCKSPDVPRLMDEMGELDYFTGKWARHGNEIVNPIGCADCHDNAAKGNADGTITLNISDNGIHDNCGTCHDLAPRNASTGRHDRHTNAIGDADGAGHQYSCDNCHGGYNPQVEPTFNWQGSMMAQSARDPLFWTAMTVAARPQR